MDITNENSLIVIYKKILNPNIHNNISSKNIGYLFLSNHLNFLFYHTIKTKIIKSEHCSARTIQNGLLKKIKVNNQSVDNSLYSIDLCKIYDKI